MDRVTLAAVHLVSPCSLFSSSIIMLPRVVLLVALAVLAEGLHSPLGKQFPKKSQRVAPGVGGDALFLTPYIKSGDLETARSLSKVNMPAVG